ncbi:Uma2 family endonuclease [Aeoliella sp. SH292]|uniref:Uma2 family endonuclease n=1 Tax=Aeoliella sp. SH292 TaxID=3454464 RepID=UPI003F94EB66
MTAAKKFELVSVEDYLADEQASDIKHEYLGGYVYAMAGARTVHNQIATNATIAIGNQLRGKKCQVFSSDMKVRAHLPTHTRFYYPDGMVVCNPNGPETLFQDHPVIVFEVLSPGTRRVDEGEKRDAYLSISSLQQYLLVETDVPRVVSYTRGDAGFTTEVYESLDAIVPLPAIEAQLPLADLYERVEFEAASE